MIVVHVEASIQAAKRQEFVAQIEKDIQLSGAFAGCVEFEWSEDVTHPNTFTLYEEWETQEAFEAYQKSDHFKQLGGILFPMMADKPKSVYYTAAKIQQEV